MKKGLYFLLSVFFVGLFFTYNANAADLAIAENTAGQTVTIPTTNVPGTDDVLFEPSMGVIISGGTSETAFVIAGYHTQVNGKKSGKQFAMASDDNTMFFRNISDDTSAQTPVTLGNTTTNVGDLDTNWTTM